MPALVRSLGNKTGLKPGPSFVPKPDFEVGPDKERLFENPVSQAQVKPFANVPGKTKTTPGAA